MRVYVTAGLDGGVLGAQDNADAIVRETVKRDVNSPPKIASKVIRIVFNLPL